MAVIKCSECGGTVSTSAKSCPHCGAAPKKFKKSSSSLITILLWVLGLGIIGAMFGGGKQAAKPASSVGAATTGSVKSTAPAAPAKAICKAAVATIMGRPASIVSATEEAGGEVALSYTRADDNSIWKYKCKLDGDRVVWAAEGGRWRVHPDDGVVKYTIRASFLEISESNNGAVTVSKRFKLSEL